MNHWYQREAQLTDRRNAACARGACREEALYFCSHEQAKNNKLYDSLNKNRTRIASSFK